MLRRLLVGLIMGLVVGSLVAAGLVAGLHQTLFSAGAGDAAFAYVAAAITGVLTGLVAGKPIWASGAKIEAGLKAFFGALLGAGLMFVARKWVTFPLDLGFAGLPAGAEPAGFLPEVSLPFVAALLGGFFELDNNAPPAELPEGGKKRVAEEKAPREKEKDRDKAANGKAKARVATPPPEEEEAAPAVPSRRAKR